MRDPAQIADALRAILAQSASIVSAELGENILTHTPAAEVWLDGGSTPRLRASQSLAHGEIHEFTIGIFIASSANTAADERQIGQLVTEFVNTLHDPAFDYTLGDLVEQVEASGYDIQLLDRNGLAFRVAVITVRAGEL